MSRRAVFGLLWTVTGIGLVARTAVRDRGVIYDHLEFGRRLVAGDSLYAPYLDPKPLHPVYPPSFGLLTWPFSLVDDQLARILWAVLQLGALAVIGVCLARWLRAHWPNLAPRRDTALLLTLMLGARYVLRDTHGGGGNLINLALALGATDLATRGRQGYGALALGVSLATKPTAILFVPLLWILGARRAALGSIGTAIALLTTALLIHGHGFLPLERWLRGSVAYATMPDLFEAPDGGFPPFSWMNQCLRCAIARYCGDVPADLAADVPGFFPGLGLGSGATSVIRSVASAALAIATFAVAWRRRRDAAAIPASVASVLALSLLVSPISWKAHHVALLPAFFLLMVRGLGGARWAWGVAIGYAVACLAGGDLIGRDYKNLQQSLYLVTAGTIVMWALCVSGSFRGAEPPPNSDP